MLVDLNGGDRHGGAEPRREARTVQKPSTGIVKIIDETPGIGRPWRIFTRMPSAVRSLVSNPSPT